MQKTKIEWCDMTWNPVTGCLHGCAYCYARRIAERFSTANKCHTFIGGHPIGKVHELKEPAIVSDKARKAPFPFGFEPTLHQYRLEEPQRHKKPQTIFVCSMADLFGDWVPDEWIEAVFDVCEKAPQHTYLFLTKNPRRYTELASVGKLPAAKNFWYGVTATDHQMAEASFRYLPAAWRGYNFYLSAEPLRGPINMSALENWPKWIIIGGMTGPGSKNRQPRYEWVQDLVAWASARSILVFMKGNLASTWGDDLIQEHPVGLLWPEEG